MSTKLSPAAKRSKVSIVKNRMTSTFAAGFLWIHLGPTPIGLMMAVSGGQILRILWQHHFDANLPHSTLNLSGINFQSESIKSWPPLNLGIILEYLRGIILQNPTISADFVWKIYHSWQLLSRHSLTQPTGRGWVSVISKRHSFQQWSNASGFRSRFLQGKNPYPTKRAK